MHEIFLLFVAYQVIFVDNYSMVSGLIASAVMLAAYKLELFAKYAWLIYVVYGLMGFTIIEFFVEIFKRKTFGKILAILFVAAAIAIFTYYIGYRTLAWSFIA